MKPYWQRLIHSTGMGAVGGFQRFQCVAAQFRTSRGAIHHVDNRLHSAVAHPLMLIA